MWRFALGGPSRRRRMMAVVGHHRCHVYPERCIGGYGRAVECRTSIFERRMPANEGTRQWGDHPRVKFVEVAGPCSMNALVLCQIVDITAKQDEDDRERSALDWTIEKVHNDPGSHSNPDGFYILKMSSGGRPKPFYMNFGFRQVRGYKSVRRYMTGQTCQGFGIQQSSDYNVGSCDLIQPVSPSQSGRAYKGLLVNGRSNRCNRYDAMTPAFYRCATQSQGYRITSCRGEVLVRNGGSRPMEQNLRTESSALASLRISAQRNAI